MSSRTAVLFYAAPMKAKTLMTHSPSEKLEIINYTIAEINSSEIYAHFKIAEVQTMILN